jgi:uncharacterized damage-inducible protein DinB
MSTEHLQYPIGQFSMPESITKEIVSHWIDEIASFPERLRIAVSELSDEQLEHTYRPGGWTIRQVIHHCADSHMNSFIRFKLALTEDQPTIKPYYEDRWAELQDTKNMTVESSLKILEGLHPRWTVLLSALTERDYARTFYHPETKKTIRLDENIGIYAWHSNHHLAHIYQAIKMGGSF